MDLIYQLYKDKRTVFRLKDVAMLTGETNSTSLNQRLNYFVRIKKLQNPRKGIYCKSNYNPAELACRVFVPAYISLEYVLQRAGIVFQYDSRITMLSYLSREIEVDGQIISYRKIKDLILIETQGIERRENSVNIATPERAFLDMVYLNGAMYFDNLRPLNPEKIEQILPIYQSKTMSKTVKKILENGRK
jgi:hypothetical protein